GSAPVSSNFPRQSIPKILIGGTQIQGDSGRLRPSSATGFRRHSSAASPTSLSPSSGTLAGILNQASTRRGSLLWAKNADLGISPEGSFSSGTQSPLGFRQNDHLWES